LGLFGKKETLTPERRRELIDGMSLEELADLGHQLAKALSDGNTHRANFISSITPNYGEEGYGEKYTAFHDSFEAHNARYHEQFMAEWKRRGKMPKQSWRAVD
jgi:hypothetical protein